MKPALSSRHVHKKQTCPGLCARRKIRSLYQSSLWPQSSADLERGICGRLTLLPEELCSQPPSAQQKHQSMADQPIGRLRAKARVILTSIQGLIVQAQTTLHWGEVLAQFATLQSQFDELRSDIATSRVLQYFAFVPGEDPGPAAGEIPNLFSVRETPAMEAQAAAEARDPPRTLSASRIHDHNRLVDEVAALLAEKPKRGAPNNAAAKRRRANDGAAGAPAAAVATAWPEHL